VERGRTMNTQLSAIKIDRFNTLYEKGCELQKGLIILDGAPRKKVGLFGRGKLWKSIQAFQEALEIHPGSWQSMFFIGKAFQALGDLKSALSWFEKAARSEPEEPSVAKEAGLCAAQLGKHATAIRLMRDAASAHPEDAGLQCNIGLSYLMSRQVDKARAAFSQALQAEPRDEMSKKLLRLAEAVAANSIPCPTTEKEILKLL
jgi:tetratricopeptide (TPR) repeat protein